MTLDSVRKDIILRSILGQLSQRSEALAGGVSGAWTQRLANSSGTYWIICWTFSLTLRNCGCGITSFRIVSQRRDGRGASVASPALDGESTEAAGVAPPPADGAPDPLTVFHRGCRAASEIRDGSLDSRRGVDGALCESLMVSSDQIKPK